ncbi:hypothetical protein K461DRAFT_148583 [Myriangium duriaei CBS 260.36]|uniref:Uncharacterized protein n=1 Tax=Myriangium duriaei CBS 260.36 TaxID=1168546 RepID=A0A9P4IZP4_9PEZI|nr:hypothetical protein K461DRAFT_148583 [Myriangium duriaei CBS 260.36]
MVWPFSRGRGKRLSGLAQASSQDIDDLSEKGFDPNNPRNATPRSAQRNPDESSLRKRRRSPDYASEKQPIPQSDGTPERRRHRSRGSVENITALPGARRLETSPHLRRSDTYRTAIPYTSSPAPASRIAAMAGQEKPKPHPDTQKRRLSKRQEYHTRAIREEEIRAMSAPVPIPKRNSANGDLLVRENKKARRNFSTRTGDDKRASTVSLPFQESIHSSMSGGSESRGWEILKLDLFSPRPSVRLSSSLSQLSGGPGLYRSGSKKEKLPTLREDVKRRDRRKMAELADDLDASDLRVLMERDTRRRDKKKVADKEKLEAKLRRRASRSRAKEREPPVPPLAIHPAFRKKPFDKQDADIKAPPTPTSDNELRDKTSPISTRPAQPAETSNADSPFRDPSLSPSPHNDSMKDPFKLGPQREDTPQSVEPTPMMETPFEDPILATAEEIRYSHGRLSQIVPSPPSSPTRPAHPRNMSPLRREYTPDLAPQGVSSPLRHSESSATKKAGTWASIFKRGSITRSDVSSAPRAGTSFSNTSRDSMSRHPLPAHLVATAPRRISGTPTRTQSIFREDLPESPSSLPDSRVNSPDIIAAANVAAARRSKRANPVMADGQGPDSTPESSARGRSKSPVYTDGHDSAAAMSASLASIDSEGSWLTGRPSKRKSTQSHIRNSVGSASRRRASDNPSFEELGIPDDELVRRLTPSPEDEAKENEEEGVTPIMEKIEDEDLPLRRNTSRRKPNLVLRDDFAVSREGFVAEVSNKESPSEGSSGPSTLESESEFDQFREGLEQHGVVYGRGHARQLSSGSAKLLEIPSRNRSGRTTPDVRKSLQHTPEPSNGRFSAIGLQSPPLSPTQTHD